MYRLFTTFQSNEAAENILCCYICHQKESTKEVGQLRKFSDCILTSVKRAAALRNEMNSDKYFEITQKTLVTSDRELLSFSYHSSCHKNYTAVKRRQDAAGPNPSPSKKPCIETRRCSVLPKSDEQGLLKGTCIFCSKCRKKKNGKE